MVETMYKITTKYSILSAISFSTILSDEQRLIIENAKKD